MKVSEAKEKVCPFSISPVITKINNDGTTEHGHAVAKCICGDCMAWIPYPSDADKSEYGYCARIDK